MAVQWNNPSGDICLQRDAENIGHFHIFNRFDQATTGTSYSAISGGPITVTDNEKTHTVARQADVASKSSISGTNVINMGQSPAEKGIYTLNVINSGTAALQDGIVTIVEPTIIVNGSASTLKLTKVEPKSGSGGTYYSPGSTYMLGGISYVVPAKTHIITYNTIDR